jgi:cytosine/adenosine deaminase-related metal-dependent hydrolase
MHYQDCIVFYGPELVPMRCASFREEEGRITELDLTDPVQRIENGATVLIPGLVNAHTHMGDSFLPDGATGLTLEEGFFRPHGFKYREIAKLDRASHVDYISDALGYMAATGTVAHFDFREQGPEGASRLKEASARSGVRSVILGQFDHVPFDLNALTENVADLSGESLQELREVLEVADGFSESTMNDLTDSAWQSIRDLTKALGKARAIHCLENEGYRDLSLARTGRGDLLQAIELYEPDIIVHLTVANAEEIQRLAESGITAVLNPRANANLGLPLPPIAKLLDAGVNLLLGTDNGLLNSPSMLAELDFTYKVTKSQYGDSLRPNPSEILKMATSNVAATRWGKELPGSLELGNPANFTVIDFHQSHLRRSAHLTASVLTRVTPADVLQTVRAGQVIYQRK